MTGTPNNPFFADDTLPRFEDITPAHAKEAVPQLLDEAKKALQTSKRVLSPAGLAFLTACVC